MKTPENPEKQKENRRLWEKPAITVLKTGKNTRQGPPCPPGTLCS